MAKTPVKKARELNDTIRYTMWSVFRATRPLDDSAEQVADGAQLEAAHDLLALLPGVAQHRLDRRVDGDHSTDTSSG